MGGAEGVECTEGGIGVNSGTACGVCPNKNQPVSMASIRTGSATRRILSLFLIL